jgi:hypothetical protein
MTMWQSPGKTRFLRTPALAAALAALAAAVVAGADEYTVSVIATGLDKPTGIALREFGRPKKLVITQVPTPGVPGNEGGMNSVVELDLATGALDTISMGEPEPVNVTMAPDRTLYWTCKSAGVILSRGVNGPVEALLTGLEQPSGIDVDLRGNVYFTEVPTPGVPGSEGGTNRVSVYDGNSITVLSMGEPEPVDVTVDWHGTAYWTCKSAGVILKRTRDGTISLLLDGLNHPVGITVDGMGRYLYFTEVPTPGVPGSMGGGNSVWKVDLATLARTIVNFGDPEPTDVAVAQNGTLFWTCTSAGVIVRAQPVTDRFGGDQPAAAQ